MSVLTPPRHPKIDDALGLARTWCAGHTIDDAPALTHAVKVTLTLDRHYPDHPVELTAAVLLHDSPEFAPEGVDLDQMLAEHFGAETARIVRALERFHTALDAGQPEPLDPSDAATIHAMIADKIVAFDSLVNRARTGGDEAAFWSKRALFRNLLPTFRTVMFEAAPHIPHAMTTELDRLITTAEYRAVVTT